jgi:uncharacterized membrane protein
MDGVAGRHPGYYGMVGFGAGVVCADGRLLAAGSMAANPHAPASRKALRGAEPLPPLYYRYATLWFILGWPAFFAVVATFYLMVFKPDL